jgi:hypothetical protein
VFLRRRKNVSLSKTERELDEGLWVVKRDFSVLDDDGIQDRAAYVLRHTIEMMLSVSSRNLQMKVTEPKKIQLVILKSGAIPYFAKATREKNKIGILPQNVRKVPSAYAIRGLDSDELFWGFSTLEQGSDGTVTLFSGFIGNDDVEQVESLDNRVNKKETVESKCTEREIG